MSIRFSYCSDLHLEFGPDLRLTNAEGAAVLLLAGDIFPARHTVRHVRARRAGTVEVRTSSKTLDYGRDAYAFLQHASRAYPKIVLIGGNHESYGGTLDNTPRYLKEIAAEFPNVVALENERIEVAPGCHVLGSTLWTRVGPLDEILLEGPKGLNDYQKIRKAPTYHRLRAANTGLVHERSRSWLDKTLAELDPAARTVVLTHHAPCSLSVPERYRGHPINVGYHSDLTDVMLDHNVNVWVHGHIHDEADYEVGDTRVLANPRGRKGEAVFARFAPKTFEL